MDDADTADCPPYDAVTELAHRLIRDRTHDNSDPFMIHGHPNLSHEPDRLVRACFYYAVVIGPRLTVLHDNDGRGGMCDMTLNEISAVWRTPDLLSSLGTDFEALRRGGARLEEGTLPAPILTWQDLAEKPDTSGGVENTPPVHTP